MTFLSIKTKNLLAGFFTVFIIFAGANAIVLTTANAQSIIGTSCAEFGAKKESCSGNTFVAIKCSLPTNCIDPKGSGCMNTQSKCDAECRKLDKCYSSGLCKPDPNLNGAAQYSYLDEVYNDCIDACKAKVQSCYSACNNTRMSCERAHQVKIEEYKKCLEQFQWEKYSERVCDSREQCVQSGDSASCAQSANPAAVNSSVPAGDSAGSFNEYMKCILAAVDVNAKSDRSICLNQVCNGSERDCLYNSGLAAKFQNCLDNQRSTHKAEIDAANDECERKYGAKALETLPADYAGMPIRNGEQSALIEEETPLEKAKILDGDFLRDFVYGLSFDEIKDLFTEENRQAVGVSQWAKLVRASEDIRKLRQNAFALGRADLRELSLYLESNSLASWERAAVNEAIERVKNNRPSLPPADFFPEPRLIEDFRNKSRGDYAEVIIKRNEEIARRSDLISLEHQRIMDALNSELGMSPLRQGLLDQEMKEREDFIEASKPDSTYTGLDFVIPFDTSLQEDTPQPPPFVSGRSRNLEPIPAPERFIQVARISNFNGRVIIERTERDGRKTYVKVERIGTSIRPAVIFNDDRIIVGQDSLVDIMRTNGNENRYVAPSVGENSTGDEVKSEVKQIELQPPDPKSPPPNPILKWLGDFFKRSVPEEHVFKMPYGMTGVKG